jgi:hypothetical protein
LRQTFAPDEKYADFENICAKPLRLMKKYADFENICAKPLRLMKNMRTLKIFAPNLCA